MSKFKLKAVGAKIIVRPVKEEEKSASGIILPESANKEKTNMGEIVALGKLTDSYKDLKEGDKVLFSEYGYDTVEYEGEEYFVMPDNKILAIVND